MMVVSLPVSLHYQVTWIHFSNKVCMKLVRRVFDVFLISIVVNHDVAEWTSHIEYSGAKKVVPGRIYSMSIHPRSDKLMVFFHFFDYPDGCRRQRWLSWFLEFTFNY